LLIVFVLSLAASTSLILLYLIPKMFPDPALGQPMDDLIRPEYQHISRDEALLAVLETGSWHGELCHNCRDGRKIPIHTTLSLIKDREGQPSGFVAVNRDLSERLQAEEALARQAKELAHSNAELEQFAYIASHDLQEPLRMVSSYIRLLSRNYAAKLGPEASEFIAFAVDGTERMRLMLNELLAYSRIATRGQSFEPTDCERVLERALLTLQVSLSDASARVTHDPLPTVAADDSQMVQVFQNLVSNAVKFRRAQPPLIHISARRVETPPGAGWLFWRSANGSSSAMVGQSGWSHSPGKGRRSSSPSLCVNNLGQALEKTVEKPYVI
jgi:signal transduction histidine kinase